MQPIPPHFKLNHLPRANSSATVTAGLARFTVLTPRLLRLEYSPSGHFEDRASQAIWYREQPVPRFTQSKSGDGLSIDTGVLRLDYAGGGFSAQRLRIEIKAIGHTWHYGDIDKGNLGGTGRTLDGADGPIPLEPGLISRDGWTVLDDSQSLVFNDDCWLVGRQSEPGAVDLYFLGYGRDYKGCLEEYTRISGPVPMIPRWALGNWWSRYWAYTQSELKGLMDDFQRHEIPLGVCIIDMDWHITKTGNQSSGWTGYSWNRDLFPDPDSLLNTLHQKGLHVALNLHPAEGIHSHEDAYPEMAGRIGIDPQSKQPVDFDIANPDFVNAYFDVLHHPQEAKGVDFWWMDWQQGTQSRVDGLDPLWWLNHLHFYDLGRDGKKRSFVFSRWGGHGNHRYPIGFSGDTVVSWKTLAFQPFFTATAANVNYGWWSHDIGGHMRGVEEGELYTRWVQYGVFSPILRLHSTKNMFQERRPWGYDTDVLRVAKDAMQLRHALIPYLYSMGWRYRSQALPPILPMYYEYPELDEAYVCPNQYFFGSEFITAPFTSPIEEDTQLSRQVVWLPAGGCFGFEDGRFYSEGWQSVYGGLDAIPLFAKRGAIVPMGPRPVWGGLENPAHLDVFAFAGADGRFELYEDDGESNAYLTGKFSTLPFRQEWSERKQVLTIGPAAGDLAATMPQREVRLHFRGIARPGDIVVQRNGEQIDVGWQYDALHNTVDLDTIPLTAGDRTIVTVIAGEDSLLISSDHRREICERLISAFKLPSGIKESLYNAVPEIITTPTSLLKFKVCLTERQMQALGETILHAGAERIRSSGKDWLVAWNTGGNSAVTRGLSATKPVSQWWQAGELIQQNGVQPGFSSYQVGVDFDRNSWNYELSLVGLVTLKFGSK